MFGWFVYYVRFEFAVNVCVACYIYHIIWFFVLVIPTSDPVSILEAFECGDAH